MKRCYDCNRELPKEVAKHLAVMVNLLIEAGTQDVESAARFSERYIHCTGPAEVFVGGAIVLCGRCIENALRQSTREGGV